MTDAPADLGRRRIVVIGPSAPRASVSSGGGGGDSVSTPGPPRQGQRLAPRFDALNAALDSRRVEAGADAPAVDPELIIVFETRGSVSDNLLSAMRQAGMDLLFEVEDEFDPDEDFPRASGTSTPVTGFLHVALANADAVAQLLSLWQRWSSGQALPYGFGAIGSVFEHLKDVHPWGAADRVRETGLAEAVAERLAQGADVAQPLQLELWYYEAAARRARAEQEVRDLVGRAGGQVVGRSDLPDIGYLALAAVVPASALASVVQQVPDAIQLLRSDDLYLARPGGQAVDAQAAEEVGSTAEAPQEGPPQGAPTIGIFDGLPMENHPRLAERIIVHDPDGLESPEYVASRRLHGTQVSSAVIWGDLNSGESPLERPVLVRPVLAPDSTRQGAESFQDHALIPDLMERAFRELFGDLNDGVAPSIRIVNVSLGEPHAPFGVIPSAWARAIDWLADKYEVLVVVSAGNHLRLDLPMDRAQFEGADVPARRAAVVTQLRDDANARRLLAPAEAINALTVGALHADDAGAVSMPAHVFDALGGARLPSVVSAIGRGVRRGVKPEILAPGGRQLFQTDVARTHASLIPVRSPLPPGLLVASPRSVSPVAGELYVRGTSGAAGLISHRAGAIYERLLELRAGGAAIERRHEAAALKCLLTHGADWASLDRLEGWSRAERGRLVAYGSLERDLRDDCPPHRVTVLAVGDLGAGQEQDIEVPLPPSLSAVTGKRRVTATLAWQSPTNWRHRQYRRAKLTFAKPAGMPVAASTNSRDVGFRESQRGTLQHQVYEASHAVPVGPADVIRVTVQCTEQAGGLGGRLVPYAVAISLEVAEELGVNVYAEVAARISTPVVVPVGGP